MSIQVSMVITNTGDGANGVVWFMGHPLKELTVLEEQDPEYWGSGDGLQCHTLNFPDNTDFKEVGIEVHNSVQEFLDS